MHTQGTVTAWIALIVALIALALAWVAFNRTGTDVGAIVEERVDEATAELRADYEALEAEFRAETAEELDEAAQDLETDER